MSDQARLALRRRARPDERMRGKPWPILVVDDDAQVHDMTRILLRDFSYEGRGFEVLSAYSSDGAAQVLGGRVDIPVALLDVVMETPDAGLRLARRIRGDMGNRDIRIILRTGQPGEAPERDVVLAYDINDYKAKSELTAQKLFTAVVGAVRAWRDIVTIGRLNRELTEANLSLEARVEERTRELEIRNRDLAQAKALAERSLERETEARGQLRQFLSMVSHEFRTPLAIIDSAAQMLMLRAERGENAMMPRLETIRGAVGRMVDLIGNCLADDQLEHGRLAYHEQMFDLVPLARAVVEQHRVAAASRTLLLDVDPEVLAWGDPGLMALVMGNLIGNAVKYSTEGPVTVRAFADDGAAVFAVADKGIGIPPADRDRVFDRFFRAGNTESISGSGIGLHMARQIVDLHGGSIFVDSMVGHGSTFTVRLRRPKRGSA